MGEEQLFFPPSPAAAGRRQLQRVTFLWLPGRGSFCGAVLLFSPGIISVTHGAGTMRTTLSSMRRVLCQDVVAPPWAHVPV